MENELIDEILIEIKKNKKYFYIDNEIIKKEIAIYLKSNQQFILTKKNLKKAVKKIRAILHGIYSSYQTKKKKKRNFYLEHLKNSVNDKERFFDITKNLLSTTISTKERIGHYKFIYEKIFEITAKPKTIIDLGCSLNPLSFPYMKLKNLNYYAYDIDNSDIDFLNNYFFIMKDFGLNGKAEILDINNIEKISKLPYSDIILIFKLIDIIDVKNKKKISEEIIKLLIKNTKFIVVSFPTVTLTGKKMNLPRRTGFELMLKRINLYFKEFSTNNEVFYLIYENEGYCLKIN